MYPEDDYAMWRDVSAEELAKANRPASKWEIVFWMLFIGCMFVAEVYIMNPR